jgi:hypothetical protein
VWKEACHIAVWRKGLEFVRPHIVVFLFLINGVPLAYCRCLEWCTLRYGALIKRKKEAMGRR